MAKKRITLSTACTGPKSGWSANKCHAKFCYRRSSSAKTFCSHGYGKTRLSADRKAIMGNLRTNPAFRYGS